MMIFTNEVPLFFQVSTVLLVDDNLSFLDNISMAITTSSEIQKYINPNKALLIISEYIKSGMDDDAKYFAYEIGEYTDRKSYYLEYEQFIKALLSTNHRKQISLIISDYSMPEMNGVEFFSSIRECKAKKIMLTGEADNLVAVQAFNDRLIDKFILKGISTAEEINNEVSKLEKQYFIDISNKIDHSLAGIRKSPLFIKVFNQWICEYKICEFSFYFESGSILGKSEDGGLKWLILMTEPQIQDVLDIMNFSNLNDSIKDRIRIGELLFCTPTEYSQAKEIHNNSKYFFESKGSFNSDGQQYFYTFINNEPFNILSQHNDE